jgi:hypothetical protein
VAGTRIAATKHVEQCQICHCHVTAIDTRPTCAPCSLVEPASLVSYLLHQP